MEFCDCWDGVSEDLEFYGDANPDEVAIREEYDEGDDFISNLMKVWILSDGLGSVYAINWTSKSDPNTY